jgi:hypothetical protein
LNKEINEKEQLQNNNHELKQNEIDLHSKIDTLIRQKNELTNAIDNISKENKQLSDTLEVTQRNLYESKRDTDNLTVNLNVTNEKISKLNNDITDQQILNDTIRDTKAKELEDLKSFMDETKIKQDNILRDREIEQNQVLGA